VSDPHPPYGHPGPPPPVPPYRPVAPASTAPAAPSIPPYAAPFLPAQHPQYAAAVTHDTPASRTLGIVALVLALTALVVTPVVAGIAAFRIGLGTGARWEASAGTAWDWSILSPVRDWALLGEIAFWVGTVLGTWALIQGMVAIAKRQGRGLGIAAVVVAVVAPGVFLFVAWFALVMGLASGSTTGA